MDAIVYAAAAAVPKHGFSTIKDVDGTAPFGNLANTAGTPDGKVYGLDSGDSLWQYDIVTKVFTQKAGLALSQIHGFVGASNNCVYAYYTSLRKYDPTTNTWTIPGATGPDWSYTRGVVASDDGYLYMTVRDGGSNEGSFWEYSVIANTITAKAAAPMNMPQFAQAYGDGKVFLFGRYSSTLLYVPLRIYTRSTNTWADVATPPFPQGADVQGIYYDGLLYMIGGTTSQPSNTAMLAANHGLVYDPVANTFQSTNGWDQILIDRLTSNGAALVNGEIYLMGGRSYWPALTFLKDVRRCTFYSDIRKRLLSIAAAR